MKKIRINRAKWRTGADSIYSTGIGDTQLVNPDYNKCCLGFITCQTVKKKISNLIDCGMPGVLPFLVPYLNEMIFDNIRNSSLSEQAQSINDDGETSPIEKEEKLKKLFKGIYELEFFGEYNYTPEGEFDIQSISDKEKKHLKNNVWKNL